MMLEKVMEESGATKRWKGQGGSEVFMLEEVFREGDGMCFEERSTGRGRDVGVDQTRLVRTLGFQSRLAKKPVATSAGFCPTFRR
jgi:hypothetical protein